MDMSAVRQMIDNGRYDDLSYHISAQIWKQLTLEELNDMVIIASLLREKGVIKLALDILDSFEEQIVVIGDAKLKISQSIEEIYCLWRLFENRAALDLSSAALEYLEQTKDKNDEYTIQFAQLLHLRGNLFGALGEYYTAITLHKESCQLYSNLQLSDKVALLCNNIGFNYSLIGELQRADSFLHDALSYYRGTTDYQDMARVLNNLGMLNFQMNDFTTSEKCFKESIELQRKIQNPVELSYSFLEFIKLLVMQGSILEAHNYRSELNELADQTGYDIIQLRCKLANAIILKTEKRFSSKTKASIILNEIISGDALHRRYAITALKHLAEIKFEELELFEDETILDEIKEIVELLQETGGVQESIVARTETDLLMSKIHLLNGNFDLARKCLYEAQVLAETKGLRNIALNISNLYDELLDQLSYWENLNFTQDDLTERIVKANIFSFLRNIQQNRLENASMKTEEAVMFLILDELGTIKASVKFDKYTDLHEYLIANLISAISSFFTTTFAGTDKIERIKSSDYTLLLKNDQQFTYCYICKGQSYYAFKKLDGLINELNTLTEFHNLVRIWGNSQNMEFQLPLAIKSTIENNLLQEIV